MRLIDADALAENMKLVHRCHTNREMYGLDLATRMVERAPTVTVLTGQDTKP
jgi:hypothetical protein